MRILATWTLLLSLLSVAACAETSEPSLADKVKSLDAQVQAEFGVSLASLPMLADASSNGFFPVAMLESSGKWSGFKDLEKAGYIRIELTNGLPDGTNSQIQFARFVLTPQGEALQAALRGA